MKVGLSKTSLSEQVVENNKVTGATREQLNEFLEAIAIAVSGRQTIHEVPEIETSRAVIEHYNRGNISGFDNVGYFVFNNVKVFELGKVDEAKKRDCLTMEQKLFGGH